MFWYCFRERDTILDLFEMSTGQRMHTRYFQVGGVFEDIPVGFERSVLRVLRRVPDPDRPVRGARSTSNEIFLQRTKGVGIVSRERLLELGVTGPAAARRRRAVGPAQGRRRTSPTADFDFKIPVGTVGDGYDRFRVRMTEMRESVRIIEQAVDGLPEGPWIADDRKVVLPPRHELSTSMEALIHHFKLVTEGFRVPPGEVYYPIESPRGELGCFVARRRLGEAGPGPLPRALVRQPAGAARHVRRRLRRRPDPEPGDARPDPRGDRPVSPEAGDAWRAGDHPDRRPLRRRAPRS